jgi:hypothetical protein
MVSAYGKGNTIAIGGAYHPFHFDLGMTRTWKARYIRSPICLEERWLSFVIAKVGAGRPSEIQRCQAAVKERACRVRAYGPQCSE